MKSKLFSILLTFSFISIGYGQNKVSISGYIRERSSGEMLSGATILLQPTNVVTNSNSYGFYSLTIQKGLVEKVFVNVPGFYLDCRGRLAIIFLSVYV